MNFRYKLILLLTLTSSAYATDGVFEINADCAEVGCFAGDSAGYPVTITTSGSYRLTGNLTTNSSTVKLITISAPGESVSVDMNGFSLRGPNTCIAAGTSFPVCALSNTGDGIAIADDNNSGSIVHIFNGFINGMAGHGIQGVSSSLILENLYISENGQGGIDSSSPRNAMLSSLTVFLNEGPGILVNTAFVNDSTVRNNDGQGVVSAYCSNVVSTSNSGTDNCTAIAPNRCDTPTQCD